MSTGKFLTFVEKTAVVQPDLCTFVRNRWLVSTTYWKIPPCHIDNEQYETKVWGRGKDGVFSDLLYMSNNAEDHHRAIRALVDKGEEGLKELYIYD